MDVAHGHRLTTFARDMRGVKLLVLLLLTLALAACSTSPSSSAPRCTPGQAAACTCVDGKSGAQTCGGDGMFAACTCEGNDSGSMSSQPCTTGQVAGCVCPGGGTGVETCQGSGVYGLCGCNSTGPADSSADAATGDASLLGAESEASSGDAASGDATLLDAESGFGNDGGEDAPAESALAEGSTQGGDLDAALDATATNGQAETGTPYLCGSAALRMPSDAGTSVLLPAIGLQGKVTGLWKDGDFVAGASGGGWNLWNSMSGLQIAAATSGTPVGLAGGVLAVGQAGQLQLFSAASGSLLATINASGFSQLGLATDGSYAWGASSTGLSVWSTSGALLTTQSGNYSQAAVFASPAHLLVALGPSGSNVVQNVPTSGAPASSSTTFSGTFASWFTDGSRFLSTVGNNVYVYTAAATQVQLVPVSSVGVVGGGGSYFWNNHSGAIGNPVDLYEVGGNGQPVKSYLAQAGALVIGSPHRLGILPYGTSSLTVIDLDASPLVDQQVTVPYPYLSAFAGDANGFWATGSYYGAVHYQGTGSAPTRSGPLGCGQVFAVAGSPSGTAAVATSTGLFVIDVPVASIAELGLVAGERLSGSTSPVPASANPGVKLSADGRTLAAAASDYIGPGATLYLYKAPTWVTSLSFPYAGDTVLGFDMSLDTSTLAQSVGTWGAGWTYQTSVTNLSGTATIWSDTGTHATPLLCPSGAHSAVTDVVRDFSAGTRLYAGGSLVAAVSGSAVGWLDDSHLLVQTYTQAYHSTTSVYSSTKVYDPLGNATSSPALPEITSFDVISPTRIFSHADNKIYDVTSGAAVFSTSGLGASAVAGPYIVSIVGNALEAIAY